MHQSATNWVLLLAYLPAICVLIVATREGWRLIDQVNTTVRSEERYRYWGRDPLRAWERHNALFPDRTSIRLRVRWLYLASMGLCALATVFIIVWN